MFKNGLKLAIFLLVGVFSFTCIARDEAGRSELARMELGALLVGQHSADYRGSKSYSPKLLPLPYFFYQGKIIKADRGGIRGEFWSSPRIQFNASVDGSLGASKDNDLRAGMPQLATAIEVGPSLDILLMGASMDKGLSFRLPIRGVVGVDKDGLDYIGTVVNPRFTYRLETNSSRWRASMQWGGLWANRHYHDYYYGVELSEELDWRPAHQGRSGYSGTYLKLNGYHRWHNWLFAVSLRYDYLGGASFERSPLVETAQYGSISFAVIRRLWTRRKGWLP